MATIADMIFSVAQAEGVDPRLAIEVGIAESNLDQSRVSPAGAIGVMQLMPATAAALGVNPLDAYQNILGGIRYLRQQLARFGNIPQALAAYNWGPERVAKAGENWYAASPAETKNYVNLITGNLATAYDATLTPSSVANGVTDAIAANLDLPDWQKIAVGAAIIAAFFFAADLLEE
jgi:soluble lytic murein transglycosylase-like protein